MNPKLIIAAAALLAANLSATAAGDAPLSERQKIVHVLDRLGFGPRPGDVERVEKLRLDAYIQQQLHPEALDVSAVEKQLVDFDVLTMSAAALTKDYYAEIRRFVERQNAKTPAPAGAEMLKDLPTRVSLRAPGELQAAKVVRAVESPRQLEEVLVDFWSNHFNIDVKKGPCRVLKVVDEREVIRPHVLGKFRDLLGASAKSPAMLVYLDNWQNSIARELSVAEQRYRAKMGEKLTGTVVEPEMANAMKPRMNGGLNENYGREILELHTLGVDGGYTQKDVTEVARCFTGWGYQPLSGTFEFHPALHDNGEKTVLGRTIPANGGMEDGEKVLDLIAAHPSTAKFIARKLCQRFIADDPPASAIEQAAKVFRETNGDLRKVVEAVVTGPEFFSPSAYRGKIKSPFEFAVSSVRALGGHVASTGFTNLLHARSAMEGSATIGYGQELVGSFKKKSLNWHVYEMGQTLYAFQAPTGWPEDSRKWISSGALIARLNFAIALTGGSVGDAILRQDALLRGTDSDKPDAVIEHLLESLVHGEASAATRDTLVKQTQAGASTVNVPQLAALVLGSPEFQRR